MNLHYWSYRSSNESPLQLQLLKSFLVVLIFSFVPTSLGLRGKPKIRSFINDQSHTWKYSLCCPNGIHFMDMLTKRYGVDSIEFHNEKLIEVSEDKIGPNCYIIDEAANFLYTNLTLTPETGLWWYANEENPFGMDLVLEQNEHFVRMYLNGIIDRIFIGVQSTPGTFRLKIIGTLPKTEDKMFTVTRNPDPKEFGELVSIADDVNGELKLSKGTPDYYLWTKLIYGTEKVPTGFSKLVKVGALDQIDPPPANGSDETYSLRVGNQFYPWLQTRGNSTMGEWKKLTPEDFIAKPKFPWFVNIYQDGTLKTTLVGMFNREEDSIGPEVPYRQYIGKNQEYEFPVETKNAATDGLVTWTCTISRNLALHYTPKLIKWNVATYRDGQLFSTHKLVNIYKVPAGGSDLLFCGTFKFVVDDWKEFNYSTRRYQLIRCKVMDPLMGGTTGGFSLEPQYLFDVNGNDFITANYIGVEKTDKEEFIFKITGMQPIEYVAEEVAHDVAAASEADPVYYLYASKISGLCYRLQATLVKEAGFKLRFCNTLPFSWLPVQYTFAISPLKRLRVPVDAISVSFKSIDISTNAVEFTIGKDLGLVVPNPKHVRFEEDPVADKVAGGAQRLRSSQTSATNSTSSTLEGTDLPRVNVESETSVWSLYKCNQYGEIITRKTIGYVQTQLKFDNPQGLYRVTWNDVFVTYIKSDPNHENVQSSGSKPPTCFGFPSFKEPEKLPGNLKIIHAYSKSMPIPRTSVVVERFQSEEQVLPNNLVAFYRRIHQKDFIPLDEKDVERFTLSATIKEIDQEIGVKSFYLQSTKNWVFMHTITTAVFEIHRIFSPSGQLGPSLSNVVLGVGDDSSITYTTTPATIQIDTKETYLVICTDPYKSAAIGVKYLYANNSVKNEAPTFIFKATSLHNLNQFHLKTNEMYMHAYSTEEIFSHSLIVTKGKSNTEFKLVTGSNLDESLPNSRSEYKYTPSTVFIPATRSDLLDFYKCAGEKCDAFNRISPQESEK